MSGTSQPDPSGRPLDRRKLIVVLYADMVGYSRLIGLDDAGTLKRLRSLRANLIDPAIDEHGGRLIQTGGDSLLIVFDSIDGAVRCAVKVQQQVPVHDGEQPPDRAIRFRIGINIGDAIADGTDLHGNAVNVAARIQAECPSGGICVTRAVRDHVRDRIDLAFEELGELNLKNIIRPVETFVVRLNGVSPAPKSVEQSPLLNTGEGLPLPDRPSIAVLAFTNMSGDPEQEYFSDGMAEDIITALSRHRDLFVIARNSSFTYRGRSVNVMQIGRELGVRYVVEGSVRRAAGQARITVKLIDALTSSHIWAERYDREVEHVFAVQSEISEAVAGAIFPAVVDEEQRRAMRKSPSSLSAWETFQRGRWHFNKLTSDGNKQARQLFEEAAKIDPGFASPSALLSQTYIFDFLYYRNRPIAEAARLAEDEARKAVAIDSNDASAQRALGAAFALIGNHRAALDCVDRALAFERNSAAAYRVRASSLVHMGRHADGRVAAFTSLRLNPRDLLGGFTTSLIATSYYFEGNYEATLDTVERSVVQYREFPPVRRYFVAALGQLGRREEAASALNELLVSAPTLPDLMIRNRPPYLRAEDHEHLLDGLRKAGWRG